MPRPHPLALGALLTLAPLALALTQADAQPASTDDDRLTEQQARALSQRLEPDTVVVESHGEGEHTTLRLRPVFGVTTTTQASINITQNALLDGSRSVSNDFPPFTARVASHVQGKGADDTFELIATFTDTDIDDTYPTANENIKVTTRNWLHALEGTRAIRHLHPDGTPADRDDVRTAPSADTELAQRLAQIAHAPVVVFPDEPVAPGAVWLLERELETDGMTQTDITRYTLDSVDDHLVTVRYQTRMLVEPQDLPRHPMSPETAMRVEQASGSVVATLTIDTRTGAPRSADITSDTSLFLLTTTPAGTETRSEHDHFVEITIDPAEEDDERQPSDD